MNTFFKLMNKDSVVLDFTICRNFYTLNFNITKVYDNKQIPLSIKSGFYDLRSWLESRYILSYRTDTINFFTNLGISNIEEFIIITKCISLNDTFWVKPMNSGVSWKSVSPYTNPINKIISDYSFNNKIGNKNIGSSPDFSTDGNFPKCWKRIKGKTYLIKAGSSGAYNAGNESYSEIFAYQLEEFLGLNSIKYEFINYKGLDSSKCELICNENFGLLSLRQYTGVSNTDFKYLVENFNCKQIHQMLVLDYLLCNTDRHFGNIWLLVENHTQRVISFSPIGDNNLSCIPYYTDEEDLIYYINDIRAKDDRKWLELISLADTGVAKEMLLKAKNFEFKPIGNKKADKRVPILNKMLKYQIREGLKLW